MEYNNVLDSRRKVLSGSIPFLLSYISFVYKTVARLIALNTILYHCSVSSSVCSVGV